MRTSALNWVKVARLLVGILSLLFVQQALGSFGSGSVGFLDRFLVIGVLLGVMGGLPLTAIAFTFFNVLVRNKQRSRITVALLGAIFGCVSWLSAAAVMAVALQIDGSGKGNVPAILAAATLIILAIASAAFAHSAPAVRHVETPSKL